MAPTSSASADEDGKPDAVDSSEVVISEASTSTQQQDDQPFPFMKLPVELRTKVYEHHLIVEGATIIKDHDQCGRDVVRVCASCQYHFESIKKYKSFDTTLFNLWTVSKATRQESLPVFFRYNRFHFGSVDYLSNFLSCISAISRRSIFSVSFTYQGQAPARAMRSLRQCVGLRRLTIQISYWTCGLCPLKDQIGHSGLMKLWGMNDLLKIRGITELEVFEKPALYPYYCRFAEQIPAFEKTLQILKMPHKAAQLTRQMNKDYPQSKAKPVRGKTNVKTRTEVKLAALETPTSH